MGTSSDSIGHERLEPALVRAASCDDVEALANVLERARDNGQFGPAFLRIGFLRGVEQGSIAATEYLLQAGADPNAPSFNKKPPALLRAIHRERYRIVRLLLDHGASLEIVDENGRTPLMTAAWRGMIDILFLLIARGANINARDFRRRNNGCKANEQDNLGRTPLH
ncbi:hypothetical protein ASPVEDRAFT_60609 [Aspergillus versicolor CBS 583.65]|uniref:Uncharacterized protein n=1 Tax=Aspergillus versicolor CBS 583.65 TaxID=1036611 RepID=A0A1L9PDW7_ASPVE|nr:uncharacterized protein ASPVEDRAFT_60609 [Aspergillus versicolor CBS 583.65]OJI99699.1 hypothetical protein ASPVEDRAFT_60609 [Aspergillus versicolor CBS 583.65]